MRYALIMAGGSGKRLWPMSRANRPKQLIPFIHGKSLLQLAMDRLDGLVPDERVYVCAGEAHRAATLEALAKLKGDRFLGEPTGRDTLNAVGFGAAVIGRDDPDAVIAVFTADHIIEPADRFRTIVEQGYALAEAHPHALVTFGIEPQHAATCYGYLELGGVIDAGSGRVVDRFQEKPDQPTAQQYLDAGPQRYLWNSGMFVWRASTLLDCIRRYEPANHDGLAKVAHAWGSADAQRVLQDVYPDLKRISVDYSVMEPASRDEAVLVAALPMAVTWLDVGSWPAFASTCESDERQNALAANRHLLLDTVGTLVVSNDDEHVIAMVGCEDLIVVHTRDATLVCHRRDAEKIKQVCDQVGQQFGQQLV